EEEVAEYDVLAVELAGDGLEEAEAALGEWVVVAAVADEGRVELQAGLLQPRSQVENVAGAPLAALEDLEERIVVLARERLVVIREDDAGAVARRRGGRGGEEGRRGQRDRPG